METNPVPAPSSITLFPLKWFFGNFSSFSKYLHNTSRISNLPTFPYKCSIPKDVRKQEHNLTKLCLLVLPHNLDRSIDSFTVANLVRWKFPFQKTQSFWCLTWLALCPSRLQFSSTWVQLENPDTKTQKNVLTNPLKSIAFKNCQQTTMSLESITKNRIGLWSDHIIHKA